MAPAGASAKCSTDRDMVGFARSAFSRSGPRKRELLWYVLFLRGILRPAAGGSGSSVSALAACSPWALASPLQRGGGTLRAPLSGRGGGGGGGGGAGEGAILPRVVAGRSARPLAGATGAGGGNASLHFFRVVPRRSRCALVRVARRRGAGRGVSSEGERVTLRERRAKVAVRHPVAPVEVGLP